MLLASFVASFARIPSRQVRYANPQTIEQASKIAVSNREPNNKKNLTRVFVPGLTIRLSISHILPVEPATKIECSNESQGWKIRNFIQHTNIVFIMAEARLQAQLVETKAELQRLRDHVCIGKPTVRKNMPLISLIPKWSGSHTAVTLEEFFSSIEGSAQVGNWEDTDKLQVAIFKLSGAANNFLMDV
jgi:hypothetical protein